jgi:hypothetical protein
LTTRLVWVRAGGPEQARGRARLSAEDVEAAETEALWRQWAEHCGLTEIVVDAPAPEEDPMWNAIRRWFE